MAYFTALSDFFLYSEHEPEIIDFCQGNLTMYVVRFPQLPVRWITMVDKNDQTRYILTHLNKIKGSTGDFLKAIDFAAQKKISIYHLLHVGDSERSGLIAEENPDRSYLYWHRSTAGTKRFPAKFESVPFPKNSSVLYSYLASLEPSNDLKTIGVSQDGFCVRRGEGEEEFLDICSFAEANSQAESDPWFEVPLRSFVEDLSGREDLLRLLPEELQSAPGRKKASKADDFPLMIVDSGVWKKNKWKANPMGILRELVE